MSGNGCQGAPTEAPFITNDWRHEGGAYVKFTKIAGGPHLLVHLACWNIRLHSLFSRA